MKLRAAFAIPGDLTSLTGGYAYDREVLARAASVGVDMRHIALPEGFPFPSAQALEQTSALLSAIPADEILLCDGLAFGVLPEPVLKTIRAYIVALVHHPLALETGLSAERMQALAQSERLALSFAHRVIVTSVSTRDGLIADYGVTPAHVAVALPGTARAPRAQGSGLQTAQLLCVGSVVPRKGYDVLVPALDACRMFDWHLTIVGSLKRAPDHTAALVAQIAASGLSDRITLAGEVASDHLAQFYDRADLFVMPSRYEGYGMVVGEAMVRGLPLVSTDGGALAETLPDGTALKVTAGDAQALGQALQSVLSDGTLRRQLADASYAAGARLPAWEEAVQIVAQVLAEAHS